MGKLLEELTVDELKEMAREVNFYNENLDHLDYYENDEYFFNDFFANKVDDAIRAVCYGDYNYMDDYVKFNAYGNLDSCSQYEYEKEIEDNAEEIIQEYIEIINEVSQNELYKKIKDIMEEDNE